MLHERLKDGDPSFGLTQGEYARRETKQRREREKKRRQRAIQALKASALVVHEMPEHIGAMDVFCTPSGYLAYYKTFKSRASGSWTVEMRQERIALPFVSILSREAH